MDEDIAAIDANTRNQKIKDFFVKFKKHIIFSICSAASSFIVMSSMSPPTP